MTFRKFVWCTVAASLCFVLWFAAAPPRTRPIPVSAKVTPRTTQPRMTVGDLTAWTELTLRYVRDWHKHEPEHPAPLQHIKRLEATLQQLQEFPPEQVIDDEFYQKHLATTVVGPRENSPVP